VNLAEMDQALGDRRIIRHRGLCFFTTYSQEEANRFKEMGAVAQVNLVDEMGQITPRTFWEVFIASMLDPALDDEHRDIRPQIVLEHFRQRDGFAIPRFGEWER
jgi:hypothetical protein